MKCRDDSILININQPDLLTLINTARQYAFREFSLSRKSFRDTSITFDIANSIADDLTHASLFFGSILFATSCSTLSLFPDSVSSFYESFIGVDDVYIVMYCNCNEIYGLHLSRWTAHCKS